MTEEIKSEEIKSEEIKPEEVKSEAANPEAAAPEQGAAQEPAMEEQEATGGTAQESGTGDAIGKELQDLVDAFTRAARAAWKSEQRKELEANLNQGLRTLVDSVESMVKQFSASEPGQEIMEQAEHVVEKVRSSKAAAEIKVRLAEGLHTVVTELQEVADKIEKSEPQEAPSAEATPEAGPEPQDIPVAGDTSEG